MIGILELLTRGLIAFVFLVAGSAKLKNRESLKNAMVEFGISINYAGYLSAILPIVEILVALLLLSALTAWWGGLFAASLFLIFNIAIASNLIKGKKTKCNCFGHLTSRPISLRTLVRNSIYFTISLFILMRGKDQLSYLSLFFNGFSNRYDILSIILLTAIVAIFIQGWLVYQLIKQNGRLTLRIDAIEEFIKPVEIQNGLHIGKYAPSFKLVDLAGNKISLRDIYSNGRSSVVLFWSSNCSPCQAILPKIQSWQQELSSVLNIVLLAIGEYRDVLSKTEEFGIEYVLQSTNKVSKAYHVAATPSALLVDSNGKISTHLAKGENAIDDLVDQLKKTRLKVIDDNGSIIRRKLNQKGSKDYVI